MPSTAWSGQIANGLQPLAVGGQVQKRIAAADVTRVTDGAVVELPRPTQILGRGRGAGPTQHIGQETRRAGHARDGLPDVVPGCGNAFIDRARAGGVEPLLDKLRPAGAAEILAIAADER